MKNPIYFPETSRVLRTEIIRLGPKQCNQIYSCKDLKELINETFSREYLQYLEQGKYFPGCPYKIYMDTYEERFNSFRLVYPDAGEIQFIDQENDIISRILEMHEKNKSNLYNFYFALNDDPHRKNLELSAKKVRDSFIDKRVYELGHFLIVPGVDPIDQHLFPRSYWKLYINPNAPEIPEVEFNRAPFPAPSNVKSSEKPADKINSFGFDIDTAKIIYQELCKSEMLDVSTTEKDFVGALTSKWNEVNSKIKISSETAKLAIFVDLFKSRNTIKNNFSEPHIEASQLFLTRTGTLLTWSNLRSSISGSKRKGSFDSKEEEMTQIVDRIFSKIKLHLKK